MNYSYKGKKRIRHNFGKQEDIIALPNMLDIQNLSYKKFIEGYENEEGVFIPSRLSVVLQSIFPIKNNAGNAILEFVDYSLEEPIYNEIDSVRNSCTYAYQIRMNVLYKVYGGEDNALIKSEQQSIYLGELPKMTTNSSLIINGYEKVIISQLSRSAGILFFAENNKNELPIFCRFIPQQGSWLDLFLDVKGLLFARISKKRKFPATILLMSLGYSKEYILSYFYNIIAIKIIDAEDIKDRFILDIEQLKEEQLLPFDIYYNNSLLLKSYSPLTKSVLNTIIEEDLSIIYPINLILNSHFSSALSHNNKPVVHICDSITLENLALLDSLDIKKFNILSHKKYTNSSYFVAKTFESESNVNTQTEALFYVYQLNRPGEQIAGLSDSLNIVKDVFMKLFFEGERYNLSEVGRFKINASLNTTSTSLYITEQDLFLSIQKLIDIFEGTGKVDDIDHLSNRRLKTVDEHLEQQFSLGLYRMEKIAKDLLKSSDYSKSKPRDFINAKPLVALVREFFNQGALAQFLDQDNPLSEVAHKRRISSVGACGITRERAPLEVRDIHSSHYGRLCAIETPEGPNIGLINYLACFATTNNHGFIITPYRRVVNKCVTSQVDYLTAFEEEQYKIVSSINYNKITGRIEDDKAIGRYRGSIERIDAEDIEYTDVSNKQIISISASLIPFIEHNDAKRSLMGSNMQRQAVPLLIANAPLVGTGMEAIVAKQSGALIFAKRSGVVSSVSPTIISIEVDDVDTCIDIYNLKNFLRSNKKTCIHQRPVVKIGDYVQKGDLLADASCSDLGELALGANILVALMPLDGYNFEDSVIISDAILEKETFTSIHIEELTCIARITKLGNEEITADIPNISSVLLSKLDEDGIIRCGMQVNPGDILVGKITPKAQEKITPEDRLLRAIFGDKSSAVEDTSLRVPADTTGTVVEVKVSVGDSLITSNQKKLDLENQCDILYESLITKLKNASTVDGTLVKINSLTYKDVRWNYVSKLKLSDDKLQLSLDKACRQIKSLNEELEQFVVILSKKKLKKELANGVLQIVKISIAMKFPIQSGDKLSGRHGNKGIISRIMPKEDMPFLKDGTVIDMVLTPLGIPSRMNIGQILECTLGLVSKKLGDTIKKALESPTCNPTTIRATLEHIYNNILYKAEKDKEDLSRFTDEEIMTLAEQLKEGLPFASPCFDGASEKDIKQLLENCNLNSSGKMQLYSGKTSQPYDNEALVGVMYFLKLDHLVDNKMHARSTGSYSLITKQPLSGRAQFGGQRFGEMEVWAAQAYGASYILQEMLTIKSDDIEGRNAIYKNIIAGNFEMNADIPASFNVLLYELKALGLNLEFLSNEAKKEENN